MLDFRAALPRFVVLYAGLYGAFGLASPFFPAFLESRGLQPEQLGILLGLATAVRLCDLHVAQLSASDCASRQAGRVMASPKDSN
jgi:PPP family 3-phenylpropionic acid transporter